MRLKKASRPQGIRTKSDYVAEQTPLASSDAQAAASLMFNRQVPSATNGTVAHASPKTTKTRYSIHSYATNKVININSNNKVTSEAAKESANNTEPASMVMDKRKSSSASNRRLSKISTNLVSPVQQHQISTPTVASPAAMAAASIVARSNPKAMAVADTIMDLDQDRLTPLSATPHRNAGYASSVGSSYSDSLKSPYSYTTSKRDNISNVSLSHPNEVSNSHMEASHEDLKLKIRDLSHEGSKLNNNSASHEDLSSTKHQTISTKLPNHDKSTTTKVSKHENSTDPNLPDLNGSTTKHSEHQDSTNSKDTKDYLKLKQPPALPARLTVTAPSPKLPPSTDSPQPDLSEFIQSEDSSIQNDWANNKSNLSFESAPSIDDSAPKTKQLHPYTSLKGPPPMFYADFNSSKVSVVSSMDESIPELDIKPNEEFLYQSPLIAVHKQSLNDNLDNGSIDNAPSAVSTTPKRKPPPASLDGGPSIVQLAIQDINEDRKKTRKPPPIMSDNLSPLGSPVSEYGGFHPRNQSLSPAYEGINESQLTFDEDVSSVNEVSANEDYNNESSTLNDSTAALPKYPTYTSQEAHFHHPHISVKGTRKLKNNARAIFGRSKSSQQQQQQQQQQQNAVYYMNSDTSSANLNPATTSQTAILIPQKTVKLKSTMRKSKKGAEFNSDKPWKHHSDIFAISEHERKRYEGVWVANKDLCIEFAPKTDVQVSDDASQVTASQKVPSQSLLMHRIIVREIFKRSRLPDDLLRRIYNLVDHKKDGYLRRHEFIVGMWLIDQALYGRKLPKAVNETIWESVHNSGTLGVNVTVGKKKKK